MQDSESPLGPISQVLGGAQAMKYGNLPCIPLPGDDEPVSSFIRNAIPYLEKSDLYRRDNILVLPDHGKKRLLEVTPPMLIDYVEDYFLGVKTRRSNDGKIDNRVHSMARETAQICCQARRFIKPRPEVQRTLGMPVPLIDSTGDMKIAEPGYQDDCEAFVFKSDLPRMPMEEWAKDKGDLPSSHGYYDDKWSVWKAVDFLYDLHKEFPFSDWGEPYEPAEGEGEGERRTSRSFACHIASMLSLFGKGCVPPMASRMGFIYNANAQRSGKTLLVKTSTIPMEGSFRAQSWQKDDEAMKKLLDAETLRAAPYICFDNVRGKIASQALEGFMTAPIWSGRVLGETRTFEAENQAVTFITGNNVDVGSDIRERFLWVDLFVEETDSQTRKVKNVIDDVSLMNSSLRHNTLNALWAIIRYWNKAGRPGPIGKPYNGFETWGKIIGGMVAFSGLGDILERPQLDNAGASEDDDFVKMVKHLWDTQKHQPREYHFHEIVDTLWEKELWTWLLRGKEEQNDQLGKITLKLDPSARSKIGNRLKHYMNGDRGTALIIDEKKVKFFVHGSGRSRKFVLTPADA